MTVKTEPSVAPPIPVRTAPATTPSTRVTTIAAPALAPAPLLEPAPEPAVAKRRLPSLLHQLVSFGLVGGVAFVVDVGIYNVLRSTLLDDKPIGAKVISVAVATLVAWLGNRALTFREQRGRDPQADTADGRKRAVWREGALFALMNVIGLGIAALCLFVSHYLFGFTSTFADNVAGNGVGLLLGMTFRFLAYRYLVFRRPSSSAVSTSAVTASPAQSRPAQSGPVPSTTAPIGGVS